MMKQLRALGRYKIYSIILLLLSSCMPVNATDKTVDSVNAEFQVTENQENDNSPLKEDGVNYYSIFYMSTSELHNIELPWKDKFSFDVVQIEDMPEEKWALQEQINETIAEEMTYWVEGKALNAENVELSIKCHSGRYLSFVNSFSYYGVHYDYINDYITIDMQTGKRVYLKDLIEINEDFARHIQDNRDKIKDHPNSHWLPSPSLEEYSLVELAEELGKCDYTKEYLKQIGYYPLTDSIGSLINKSSFFVRDGMVVMIFGYLGGEQFMTFDIDDIEDYLKVEKW